MLYLFLAPKEHEYYRIEPCLRLLALTLFKRKEKVLTTEAQTTHSLYNHFPHSVVGTPVHLAKQHINNGGKSKNNFVYTE